MRIARKYDCAFGVLLLLVSAFLFHETYNFRSVAYFSIGPTAFPRGLLTCLMILSACLIYQSLTFSAKTLSASESGRRPPLDKKNILTQAWFVGFIILYAALMKPLGYMMSSALFLFAAMVLLGKRTPRSILVYIVISIIVSLIMQYIFKTLMKLFLP